MSLKIARPPFLIAVGDDVQLLVSRSAVVSTESDAEYQLVTDYIRERGMVLVSREVGPEERMYGPRVEQSHYAIPEARNLFLMTTEETPTQ